MISNRGLAISFSVAVLVIVIISFLFVIKGDRHQQTRRESVFSFLIPFTRGIKYNLNEYADFMTVSQKQILDIAKEIRTKEITLPKLVIVSQLVVGIANRDKLFYLDLLTSIQMNLLNPSVAEYHLLQIDANYNSDVMSLMHAHKIKIHNIHEQLTTEIFVKYCNEHLKDRTVVYLNQPDVYFDNSLLHTSKIKYGEFVKIHKRVSMSKPYDCENGQGTIPDGIIFRTSPSQPLELGIDEEALDTPIITLISDTFKNHNCEVSTSIFAWFLHDPIHIDKRAEKEAELKELERLRIEREKQLIEKQKKEMEEKKKLEEEKKIKEEQERKQKEEDEKKKKEEEEKKLKEEEEKKQIEAETKKEEGEKKIKEENEPNLKSGEMALNSSTNSNQTKST